MGDIADGLINGDMCELCSEVFEKGHGFPVVCGSCWKGLGPMERRNHVRATE